MEINNQIMKSINDNLTGNFDPKVIDISKDLTLLDIFALINTLKVSKKL